MTVKKTYYRRVMLLPTEDGSERPIAFASRSLSPAEKNYAQLDKGGLAIIFGVKKFHHYLLRRHFTIQSDHKPLQHLFGKLRSVPPMASARIQRWTLTLAMTLATNRVRQMLMLMF